jgi:hypothetical protein
MPAFFIESPFTRRTNSPSSPPAIGGTVTYSSMFSSARIGWPAATCPTSGNPLAAAAAFALSTKTSIARGLVGSRRSSPSFSRFARCACTVDDEVRPMALPISRTVGG